MHGLSIANQQTLLGDTKLRCTSVIFCCGMVGVGSVHLHYTLFDPSWYGCIRGNCGINCKCHVLTIVTH